MAYAIPAWLLQQLQGGGPIVAPASQIGAYGTNALGPAGSAVAPSGYAAQGAIAAAPHYSELLAPYAQRALPAARTAIPMPASTPAAGGPIAMPQFQGTGMDVPAWQRVGADLNANLTAVPQPLSPGLAPADIEALYSGGARGAAGVATPVASSVAPELEAVGGTGVRARLAGMAGNTSAGIANAAEDLNLTKAGLLGPEGLGAYKAALSEGGLKGLGGVGLARIGQGLAFDAEGNLIGQALPALTGTSNTPGGRASASAGSDVGLGAGIGTMIAGPPGAVVGAAVGGLKAIGTGLGELSQANSYEDATDKFTKLISSLPDKQRKALGQRAYAGFQAYGGGDGDHDKQMADLAKVYQIAQGVKSGKLTYNADAGGWMTKKQAKQVAAQTSGPSTIGPMTQRRLAIQNAAAQFMAPLAAQVQQQGQAFGAQLGAIPGVDPALAQYDAAQREQYGNQTAAALMGSAYAQPLINDINGAIQQQQNYLAQLNAARTSGNSSPSFADALKQAGISKKKP